MPGVPAEGTMPGTGSTEKSTKKLEGETYSRRNPGRKRGVVKKKKTMGEGTKVMIGGRKY